jgi:hypothetical protein
VTANTKPEFQYGTLKLHHAKTILYVTNAHGLPYQWIVDWRVEWEYMTALCLNVFS